MDRSWGSPLRSAVRILSEGRGGALLFLTAVNAVVSYAPWPSYAKAVLLLLGCGAPLILMMKSASFVPARGREMQEASYTPTGWLPWAILLAIASFLRFYRLTDLPVWPMFDESYFSFFAVEFARTGNIDLLSGYMRLPPLLLILQGLWFKVFEPSLGTLWAFSSLMGVAVLPAAWAACRSFRVPSGWTFIFVALTALNYWTLYASRLCIHDLFMPVFQFLALAGLGQYLREEQPGRRAVGAALLGLGVTAMVMSSYFLIPTIVLVGIVVLVLAAREPGRRRSAAIFLVAAGIPSILFADRAIAEGIMHQLLRYSYGSLGEFLRGTIPNAVKYAVAIFWGTQDADHFTPLAGGFLNPIMTSLFLIGLVQAWRMRSHVGVRVGAAVLVFYGIPVFMKTGIEMFRVYGTLPFLLISCVLGLRSVVSGHPPARQTRVLLILIVISCSFDAWRLLGPFAAWSVPKPETPLYVKSLSQWRVHQVLTPIGLAKGRGWIFERLKNDVESLEFLSLRLSTHRYNAFFAKGLVPSDVQWASLTTNLAYLPYLRERFPHAVFRWMNGDVGGRQMMAIIPSEDFEGGRLVRLIEGEKQLEDVFRRRQDQPDLIFHTRKEMDLLCDWLVEVRPRLPDDPFILASWSQKLVTAAHDAGRFDLMMEAAGEGVTGGCRTAMTYYNQGWAYWKNGKKQMALESFRTACRMPFDTTSSHRFLEALGEKIAVKSFHKGSLPSWKEPLDLLRAPSAGRINRFVVTRAAPGQ